MTNAMSTQRKFLVQDGKGINHRVLCSLRSPTSLYDLGCISGITRSALHTRRWALFGKGCMLTQLPDFHALSHLSSIASQAMCSSDCLWESITSPLPVESDGYLCWYTSATGKQPRIITFYKDLDKFLLSFQLLSKSTSTRTQEMRGKRKDAKISL